MKAETISLSGKVDYPLQLVWGKAKSKVAWSLESSDVWTLLTSAEQTPTSVGNCFTNITIKKKITALTPKEISNSLAAPNHTTTMDSLAIDRIEEALHGLKIHVFGCDHAGCNALVKYNARCTISRSQLKQKQIDNGLKQNILLSWRQRVC